MRLPSTALLALALAAPVTAATPPDPLEAEIARWTKYLEENTSKDEMWSQVKQAAGPLFAKAEAARREGLRLLALQRLTLGRMSLAAWRFVESHDDASRGDAAAFELEWKRSASAVVPASAKTPERLEPAALRALAESEGAEAKEHYDASLEFGRARAVTGYYYLGIARAQREFVELAGSLSEKSATPPPRLRSLAAELDRLEDALLAAYVPPRSIDKHSDFIAASGALKEARELDASGLRYGALLKACQAAMRLALVVPPSSPGYDVLDARIRELARRLDAPGVDHSIGKMLLQLARWDVAHPTTDGKPDVAVAILGAAIPFYFDALGPAPRSSPRPAPKATVTLVRWPYT